MFTHELGTLTAKAKNSDIGPVREILILKCICTKAFFKYQC